MQNAESFIQLPQDVDNTPPQGQSQSFLDLAKQYFAPVPEQVPQAVPAQEPQTQENVAPTPYEPPPSEESIGIKNLRAHAESLKADLELERNRARELEAYKQRLEALGDQGYDFATKTWQVFSSPFFDRANDEGLTGPEQFFRTLSEYSPRRAEDLVVFLADKYGPELVHRVIGEKFTKEEIQAFREWKQIPQLKDPDDMEFNTPEEEAEYRSVYGDAQLELTKLRQARVRQEQEAQQRAYQEEQRQRSILLESFVDDRRQVASRHFDKLGLKPTENDPTDVVEMKEVLSEAIESMVIARLRKNPTALRQWEYALELATLPHEKVLANAHAVKIDEFISQESQKIASHLEPVIKTLFTKQTVSPTRPEIPSQTFSTPNFTNGIQERIKVQDNDVPFSEETWGRQVQAWLDRKQLIDR